MAGSKFSLVVLVMIFAATRVFAVNEQFYGEKIGSAFAVDSILIVKDDKFNTAGWDDIDTNISVDDFIIFEINDDTSYIQTASFTCEVTLRIQYWDSSNADFTIFKTLAIDFDPAAVTQYNGRAIFKMKDAHKLKITIEGINYTSGLGGARPPVFRLRAEIHIERKYLFDCQATINAESTQNSTKGTIIVGWDEVAGAEEYDLEWTFYHDSSEVVKAYKLDSTTTFSNYNELFRHNGTRVTITENIFSIQNIFEKGYVFYRIRAVQYSADSIRKQTPWLTDGFSESFEDYEFRERVLGHENNLNWQFSVQFAEEGKHIPSVNYFDGSMRSRQTVVRSESAGRIIVSETLYDHQGRAVIQTIPAPTDDTHAKICYNKNFSVLDNTDTVEYRKDAFDIGECDFVVPAMDSTYGAARYFSKNNPDWNNAIATWTPSADRYPFSVTEYTPDLTGRIKRQTNVGSTFKLGGGRETKYFYGPADQAELDRVFGNEIGLNEHYWKTMVMDPNGSISVSYTDGSGHVIATALAGETPSNLSALASNSGADTIITNLLDVAPIPGPDFIEYNYTLLVSAAGEHTFYLSLDGGEFEPECLPEGVCLDCLYDLTIEVTDICNNTTLPDAEAYSFVESNYTPSSFYDTTCLAVPASITDTFKLDLEVGEYHVKYHAAVSTAGKDQYLAMYIRDNTCILPIDSFISAAEAELDFSGCNLTCEDCLLSLGSLEGYIEYYITELEATGATASEEDTIDATNYYNQLLAECDAICDTILTECEALYGMLIADVTPGGQYAKYTVDGAGNYIAGDTSILNASLLIFEGGYTYIDLDFMNEFGEADSVFVDGVRRSPNELTVEQFVQLFPLHDYWAATLVQLHPEYCVYEWCSAEGREEEYEYAAQMLNTELFDSAVEAGFLDPVDINILFTSTFDPFFATGRSGVALIDSITADMVDYQESTYNMWELASTAGNCPTGDCTPIIDFDAICDGNARVAWVAFRTMYLERRSYYFHKLIEASCSLDDLNIGQSGDFATMQRRYLYSSDAYTVPDSVVTETDYDEYADTLLEVNCISNCTAMSDGWIMQIAPCYETLTESQLDSLLTGFIEVCVAGCDFYHPFGSSDLDDGSIPIETTASGYSSFQDVLEEVFGVLPGDTLCNGYLIEYPDPFGDYTGMSSETFMGDYADVCVCEKWVNLYENEYDSLEYDNFAEFLAINYNSTLTEATVNEILNVCQDDSCFYTSELVTLPVELSCSDCVPCQQGILNVYNNFFEVADFPTGGFEGYEVTLTAYLNSYYGYNLTYFEWKEFLENCFDDTISIAAGETTLDFDNTYHEQLCDRPIFSATEIDTADCREQLLELAFANATLLYEDYIDSIENTIWAQYVANCLASANFSFDVKRPMNEYHYTLYYYDQSGNLTQTVPPEGVDFLDATEQSNQATYRLTGTGPLGETDHQLKTRYYYNTLNQLIKQYTPDGDTTRFWYDRLGRIVVSQNARQRQNDQYSFTRYDNLGRIYQTGQLEQATEMTFAIALDNEDLFDWIDVGTNKREISSTFYDNEALPVGVHFTNSAQTNLRNRISSVTWETVDDEDSLTYDYATHYSYDVSGNVFTLIQELGGLRGTSNDFKRMDYEYDLISGKVNQVSYQPDSADQFYHQYIYDEDNRLVNALTSIDEHLWQNEATYLYYKHGPLRRTEIGERQVQGMDFAYTLQGWLKGMNSEGRDQGKDMGGDGKTSGSHKLFGRDVASFLLSYFEGDYRPIGTNRFTATYSTSGGFGASSPSLYNGNIRKATYSLANLTDPVVGYAYGYDQLNRLISMDAWFNFNTGTYAWQTSGNASSKLQERVSYDANGNITKYLRKGYSPTNMDSLTYKYYPKSNKLLRVDDAIGDAIYTDIDVDDQDNDNYEYDLTGNLVKDSIEGISLITWNLMGKVDSIARYDTIRPELKFLYDAMGNRVGKVVYDGADVTKTWYIRDAQGNIMATYEEENDTLTWTEQHIYGSSRLGYWQPDSMMYPKPTPPATDTFRYVVRAGDKLYEISNHLGNVLASITDRKIPQETGTPNGIADYYLADIATVQDYYPFGMVMPGRSWQAATATGYGFGFNGKLNDDDVRGSYQTLEFGGRGIYNPRISRFFSIDPIFEKYPWQSSYIFANNRPIQFIDYEGLGVNGGFSVINQSSQPIHITGSGAIGKLISQSEKPTEPNIWRNQETEHVDIWLNPGDKLEPIKTNNEDGTVSYQAKWTKYTGEIEIINLWDVDFIDLDPGQTAIVDGETVTSESHIEQGSPDNKGEIKLSPESLVGVSNDNESGEKSRGGSVVITDVKDQNGKPTGVVEIETKGIKILNKPNASARRRQGANGN